MSREYSIQISGRDEGSFFSSVRSKEDILLVLMETIKRFLIKDYIQVDDPIATIRLRISKMNRLFYFSENKYFSINFPFGVFESPEGSLEFYSTILGDLNSKIVSRIKSIVGSEEFRFGTIYDCLESMEGDDEEVLWRAVRWLMVFEDGYIRYDYDNSRDDPVMHPLNHLDIFYSSSATFKLGLREKISNDSFVDLLDIGTACHYCRR